MKGETIKKCFRKAVILDSDMDVVSCDVEDNPFQDLDNDNAQLHQLINKAMPGSSCSVEEYTNSDEDLATCVEMDDDRWVNVL